MGIAFVERSDTIPDNHRVTLTRRDQARRRQTLFDFFRLRFPGPAEVEAIFGFVPGRIEVFGRHTDYAGGRSMVCAIDRGFHFIAAPNDRRTVRMAEDSSEFEPIEFSLGSPTPTPRPGHWANYPIAMARRLARNFGNSHRLKGIDVAFSSTLPVGSGMSGSSALMMLTFTALAAVNRLHETVPFLESIRNDVDLAVYLACVENGQGFRGLRGSRGVGTFGGSEDHAAILAAKLGRVSLFSFRPATLDAEVTWPREWRMVVGFSGVRAEKTREALEKYNMVSRRAREAVSRFNQIHRTQLATLREVADRAATIGGSAWMNKLDSVKSRAPGLADRTRQFILEDRRYLPAGLRALQEKDIESLGKALTGSHRASKRYLCNIAPEIDFLQRSAVQLGAAGASGFGAGFGGSIFAVVRSEHAKRFLARWRDAYHLRYPRLASVSDFFLTSPGPGIELWGAEGPVRLVDLLFQT